MVETYMEECLERTEKEGGEKAGECLEGLQAGHVEVHRLGVIGKWVACPGPPAGPSRGSPGKGGE